jgi:hypothetical protein
MEIVRRQQRGFGVASNSRAAARAVGGPAIRLKRDRGFADSPLEEGGFELSVPALRNEGSDARNVTENRLTLGSGAR